MSTELDQLVRAARAKRQGSSARPLPDGAISQLGATLPDAVLSSLLEHVDAGVFDEVLAALASEDPGLA